MENETTETGSSMKVNLFDVELYHGQNKLHSIQKRGITRQEITLLRAMHGQDSILEREIKTSAPAEAMINERELLFKLAREYGNTSDPLSGKRMVEKVLNVTLNGFEQWLDEEMQLEEQRREEMRQRSLKEQEVSRAQAALAGMNVLARHLAQQPQQQ